MSNNCVKQVLDILQGSGLGYQCERKMSHPPLSNSVYSPDQLTGVQHLNDICIQTVTEYRYNKIKRYWLAPASYKWQHETKHMCSQYDRSASDFGHF